jgi:hypothetical protein
VGRKIQLQKFRRSVVLCVVDVAGGTWFVGRINLAEGWHEHISQNWFVCLFWLPSIQEGRLAQPVLGCC